MSPHRPSRDCLYPARLVDPRVSLLPLLAGLALAACQQDATAPEDDDAPASLAAASVGSWIAGADYPRDVWHPTSAAITNPSTQRTVLYVIGGRPRRFGGAGAITDAVKAYDVSANRWQSRAPYPVRIRSTNGAVTIDGKIYVTGGFTRRFDAQRGVWRVETLKSLYVYDPAADRWTRRSDMPIETVNGVSAAHNGMLYVATPCYDDGFCGQRFDQGALWRYNPATDRWVLLGRTPHDPWDAAGGFIGGKFYLVEFLGAMDIYDVATNSWSTGTQRPFRACAGASATLQARLYLVGCRDDFDESGDYPMQVFDPAAGTWSEAAAPPVPADDLWALSRVAVNGQPRLQLVGGEVPGNNWQFVP
jgi:hypothetical protein